ncbi:MAG: DUF6331 family protein [Deinococcota bacterium]
MMTNSWSDGVDPGYTQTSREILEDAQADWYERSRGLLELVLEDALSKAGNSVVLVYIKHVPTNKTAWSFSILRDTKNKYPITIQPGYKHIQHYQEESSLYSLTKIARAVATHFVGNNVSNQWIAHTPTELREKLIETAKLAIIMSKKIDLSSTDSRVIDVKYAEWRVGDYDIRVDDNLWLQWIGIEGRYHEAQDIDNIIDRPPLDKFWTQLETICVKDCCGLDAFDFRPKAIAQATAHLATDTLQIKLEQVRDTLQSVDKDIVSSVRLNSISQKDFFISLLDHILNQFPA